MLAATTFCSIGVARAEIVLGPAAIAATVRDANGKPVAGARVVATGPTERDGVTGAAGLLMLQALPLGSYAVRVTRSGYEPFDATLRVVTANAPTFLTLRLVSSTFASLRDGIAASATTALGEGSDPYAAHAVALAPGALVVPSTRGAGAGIVLDGAAPEESRVERDGIPVAGGAQAFAALRFANALPLTDVSIARGPSTAATTVRDTIGGVVDYRTPGITNDATGGLDAGYDSAFGSFQHARYSQTFGPLGVLLDTVTGGGENRSQIFKARYALSTDVSLGFASYGSQSQATLGNATETGNAPAFATDLRASLGSGTLKVRSFESSEQVYADGDVPLENARIRGLQLGYDIPQGQNLFAIDYDRRAEDTTFGDGTIAAEQFHALTVRGNFGLSQRSRLELADSFEGGTTFATRGDPRLAFAFRASDRVTFRLAAGSAFATEPAEAFASAVLATQARAPETSFDVRLRADAALGGGITAWASTFETRRFARPATLPDAFTTGLELGLSRSAAVNRFGGSAYLDVARGIESVPGSTYYDGVPASKARVALAYRLSGVAFDFGTTLLGANNAFAPHAVMLGDVALRLPVFHLADVKVGIENLYGTRTSVPTLQPLFAPREFTLTIGRSPGT